MGEAGLAQLSLLDADGDEWAAAGCSGLSDCLSGLSEEETMELAEALSQELGAEASCDGRAAAAALALALRRRAGPRPAGPPRSGGPTGRARRPTTSSRWWTATFSRNLKERLDLTDEEFGRVVPHVQRLQSDRRDLMRRRFRAMHELRQGCCCRAARPKPPSRSCCAR